MTLHEAIVKVLQQAGRAMTTGEIADALNRNKWYEKKDKSLIIPYQIHGRTKNYPQLFDRQGSVVLLRGNSLIRNESAPVNAIPLKKDIVPGIENHISPELTLKMLMLEKNFKSAADIDDKVPNTPGLYCIRISDIYQLPEPFSTFLETRKHNILYIGIATTSLSKRFLGQELRAKGHGTFFRGIGAMIGFLPQKDSLKNYINKNNYRYSPKDEQAIIKWINSNLLVNWVEFSGNYDETETLLIRQYLPLLNADKNPAKLPELLALRRECRNIANG